MTCAAYRIVVGPCGLMTLARVKLSWAASWARTSPPATGRNRRMILLTPGRRQFSDSRIGTPRSPGSCIAACTALPASIPKARAITPIWAWKATVHTIITTLKAVAVKAVYSKRWRACSAAVTTAPRFMNRMAGMVIRSKLATSPMSWFRPAVIAIASGSASSSSNATSPVSRAAPRPSSAPSSRP